MGIDLVILAGGDGTRLKSVTGDVPKPLVDFNGVPFLNRKLLDLYRDILPDRIFLLIQRRQFKYFNKFIQEFNVSFNKKIQLVVEETKLGTGGAVKKFFQSMKSEQAYISNADTIIRGSISMFRDAKPNSILCSKQINCGKFDNVIFNDSKLVTDFYKERSINEQFINAGIYHLNKTCFQDVEPEVFELESHLFPELIKKSLLFAYPAKLQFEDIGTPAAYYSEVRNAP